MQYKSLFKKVSSVLFFIIFIVSIFLSRVQMSYAEEPIPKKDVDINDIEPRAKMQQLQEPYHQESNTDITRFRSGVNTEENPQVIRVAITEYLNCKLWVDAGQPVVRVETIDFKEYVKNVLPNEWIASWHEEALKSGAIAAKNYGWCKIYVGGRHYLKNMHDLSDFPDVVDNTCDQVYLPGTKHERTSKAVDDIWNYRLIRDDSLLVNFYLATGEQCENSPYQPCLPQWETQYRAVEGKSWQSIIHQYYDPVEILTISDSEKEDNAESLPEVVEDAVYRFWSDQKQGHFYTASLEERNHVIKTYDDAIWQYEGIAHKASQVKNGNMIPVYRFWSDENQGHFYTASTEEKEYVEKTYPEAVWRDEGVAFYVYPLSYTGSSHTVYRFWSDQKQKHFYTASKRERDYIINVYDDFVWRYEGKAWKALP